MPRMKFGYDTMLNVLLLAAQHKGYVVQPWRPTSTEEFLKGYIFIMYKNVVQ